MIPNRRHMRCTAVFAVCALSIVTFSSNGRSETPRPKQWPHPAVRTGTYLPPPRTIALYAGASGAWVPKIGDLSAGDSLILQGDIVWNFSLFQNVAVFGSHSIGTMSWANVRLLNSYNEVGLRLRANSVFTVETAYLAHRVDVSWIDDLKVYLGGVLDHGAEVKALFHFELIDRIRIEPWLCGRYFSVYTEDHAVLGYGVQIALLPVENHSLALGVDFFDVWRHNARPGADTFTHNTMARMEWQSQLSDTLGFRFAAEVSTNLLVGKAPMLELKRSMTGEPMALASAGIFVNF